MGWLAACRPAVTAVVNARPHLCLLGDAESVHLRRWAGEMLARGLRVSVVTARPGPIDGVEQRVLAPVRRSTDWLWRARETKAHLRALAPDLVHAHYVTSYGHLGARAGHHPLVITAWGSDLLVTPHRHPTLRWLTAWTLRRADLLTGDSPDLIDRLSEFAPRVPGQLVHWGVDSVLFRAGDWAAKRGFQIVSLRAWEPNYRIDAIVQAVARLYEWRPQADVTLHLLGGGTGEAALRALAGGLGLGERVRFHGRVGDAGMVDVMQACKVSVSVPVSDATSVSVLESMACALPVLASDLPANRYWLGAGDGVLLPAVDADTLAAALARLFDDDPRAERIGRANQARIERNGARAVQMDAMAALYHGLLERRGGAAERVPQEARR